MYSPDIHLHALCFILTYFLFVLFLLPAAISFRWLEYWDSVIFILVFQSQPSNGLPNGTLFQVKVAFAYTPVHDDELTINPNDIINVTRMVCWIIL
jgi:hypothetical protein